MKRALIVVLSLAAVSYVAALVVSLDPHERRPGLRLEGALAEEQDTDWSFLQGRELIFVETRTAYGIRHSVTTSYWVHDGNFYVGCARCGTKRWPKHVERDPRVRLKVAGALYERVAVRIDDPEERRQVFPARADGPTPDDIVVFRMDPGAG